MNSSTPTAAQAQHLTEQNIAALTELVEQTLRQNELIFELITKLRNERDALAAEVTRLKAAA